MYDTLRLSIWNCRLAANKSRTTCARELLERIGTSEPTDTAVARMKARWRGWEEGKIRIPAELMRPIAAVIETTVCALYHERPDPDEVVRLVEEAMRGGVVSPKDTAA